MDKFKLKEKIGLNSTIIQREGKSIMVIDLNTLFPLIDQLDEPKPQLTGKYELEEFLDRVLDERHFDSFNEVYDDIISFIDNQLDEPEKVVVPDFVGDYIERAKEDGMTLQQALQPYNRVSKYGIDLRDWKDEEVLNFSHAWLFGYTVEEKKYRVEVPDKESNASAKLLALCRTEDGRITINKIKHETMRESERVRLTEEEIKRNHEYLWPFAEEVTK